VAQRKVLRASPTARSDVRPFGPCLDKTLYAITRFEQRLGLPMPAGGSVLATAVKPIER
jgi:hypothetical protein